MVRAYTERSDQWTTSWNMPTINDRIRAQAHLWVAGKPAWMSSRISPTMISLEDDLRREDNLEAS